MTQNEIPFRVDPVKLSLINFFANLIFFIAVTLIIFQPNLIIKYKFLLNAFFIFAGLFYYLTLLVLSAHFAPIIRDFADRNRPFFFLFMWSSAYIIGFLLFYRFINKTTAYEIFGAGIVLFVAGKISKSFKVWRKKLKTTKKRKIKELTSSPPNQP